MVAAVRCTFPVDDFWVNEPLEGTNLSTSFPKAAVSNALPGGRSSSCWTETLERGGVIMVVQLAFRCLCRCFIWRTSPQLCGHISIRSPSNPAQLCVAWKCLNPLIACCHTCRWGSHSPSLPSHRCSRWGGDRGKARGVCWGCRHILHWRLLRVWVGRKREDSRANYKTATCNHYVVTTM